MGTIMLNGIKYGGGGDFAGAAFIDTDNVIVTLTALPSSVVEYTATEDCYLYVQLGGQQENYVDIDGERAFYSHSTNWQIESGLMPLAKGQTAEIHGRQTSDYYAVYGVKYSGGSSGGGGISYSTNEQDTGLTWIDGSEIYQTTVVFSSLTAGAQTLQHGISGVDTIIDAEGIVICNDASNYVMKMNYPEFATGWYASLGFINQTTIDIRMGANMISSYPNLEAYVTIRYTKTGGNA